MTLSDLARGRDNNFNLIRIIAALAVLTSHSFALVTGTGDSEPLRQSLGVTPGSIAVDIFFLTSGFLVTGSLISRKSAIEFIWARILRIFPALFVMVSLTVFGLGMLFTTLPGASYLSHPKVFIYFVKNTTLVSNIAWDLPGVFESNPFKNAVNGSLWSLPIEVRMYVILAVGWLVMRILPAAWRPGAFKGAVLATACLTGVSYFNTHVHGQPESLFVSLAFMFFTGAAFYILKEHIKLSRTLFWILLLGLLASSANARVFFWAYHLALPYVLFFLAYVPAGRIRSFNQLGDYSYGLYIYAFPVQQAIVALIPGISVRDMFLTSALLTLGLAAVSWHLLEQPVLQLKDFFGGYTRRLLGYIT